MKFTAAVLALLLTTAAQAAEPVPAEQGFALARARCAACHALDGVHDSPRGAPPFPDIGQRYQGPTLERRIEDVTRSGHYAMPPRRLTADERRLLAAYIRDAADRAAASGL